MVRGRNGCCGDNLRENSEDSGNMPPLYGGYDQLVTSPQFCVSIKHLYVVMNLHFCFG